MTFPGECICLIQRNVKKNKHLVSPGPGLLHFCRIFFILTFVFLCGIVNGQGPARNAVYAEFASRGPVYSINYDRIFRQGNKLDYSFSVGFSIAKNSVAFPVGIHFITAAEKHHAEFGLTLIPYIDHKNHLVGSNSKSDADKYLFINPSAGYRYQAASTGLFLKAAIGPSIFLDPPSDDFWNMDPKLYAFGSIAVGISF
jgi:hypothetical protein